MLESFELGDIGDEFNRVFCNSPFNAIHALAAVNSHFAYLVVHTKDPGEPILKRNDSTVENAVGAGHQVPWDDGVAA